MQAVILAGGLGTRLWPLTREIPKPMIPVAGCPYLEHQLRLLRKQGILDIAILTGYLGDQIEHYFGDGSRFGLSVRYSREEKPLGTGGALCLAKPLLADSFVILYGDSYLPIGYRAVHDAVRPQAEAVLVIYSNLHGDTSVRNNVAVDADSRVTRYEKDAPGAAALTHVDAGVLALRRSALELCENREVFSLEKDLFPKLIARRTLFAYETRQRFYDIGTPERLEEIERFLREQQP